METQVKSKKMAKWFILSMTIIYAVIYPFVFFGALFTSVYFLRPDMSSLSILSIILPVFCIPISIPVSIFKMWFKYLARDYKRMSLFTFLPILTSIVVLILECGIELFCSR